MMPEQHEQLPARLRDHDSEWWQLFDTSINVISGTVCVRCARAESNSDSAVLLVLVLVLRVWGHDDVGGRDRVRTVWYVDVNTHDGRYTMDDVDDWWSRWLRWGTRHWRVSGARVLAAA